MIQRLLTRTGRGVAQCYRLVVILLDRLFSWRVPQAGAIDVYASRVALCEEYDTEIRYIGTPARYNSVRLLPLAIVRTVALASCLAGLVYWSAMWQPFKALIALFVGMFLSAALLPLFRTEYRRHVRRVFTITDISLLSESPVDSSWKTIDRIHYLWVQQHADGTVTITCSYRYSEERGLHNQLRRLDAEEAEKIVSGLQELSSGCVEVVADGGYWRRLGMSLRPDPPS